MVPVHVYVLKVSGLGCSGLVICVLSLFREVELSCWWMLRCDEYVVF